MTDSCYIQIAGLGILELDKAIPISLNYTIAAVQDISKGDAHYSKQIFVPFSKNNNLVMGNLSNINLTDSTFDITVKNKAIFFSSGLPLLRGYIQLVGVNKTSKTSINGDQTGYYEIIFFDDKTTFYEAIGTGYLSDMNLSRFNHTFTLSAIQGSYTHTFESGYTYPQLNNLTADSTSYYEMNDYKPAIFYKTYIDQMFEDAGFTYTSNFLNSDPFTKLIIPYNGDVIKSEMSGYTFRASYTAQTSYQVCWPFNGSPNLFQIDKTSGLNFDNPGTFSINGSFTSPFKGKDTHKVKYRYKLYLNVPYNTHLVYDDGSGPITGGLELTASNYIGPGGMPLSAQTAAQLTAHTFATQGQATYYSLTAGEHTLIDGLSSEFSATRDVEIGTNTRVLILANLKLGDDDGNTRWVDSNDFNTVFTGSDQPELRIRFGVAGGYDSNSGTSYWYNVPTPALQERGPVIISDIIPKIKKIDLWNDLVKMFNLYCEVDSDNDRNLIIKTRQEYYSGSSFQDWTDIIDDSSETIKFLSELQSKTLNFTFTDDSDFLNKTYKDSNNLTYGQLQVNFESEFLQGTKDIKVNFSQTPLFKNNYGQIVPYIDGKAPKCNARVLYHGGIVNGPEFKLRWFTGTTVNVLNQYVVTALTIYNYAGEFDDFESPRFSLNFGNNQDIYYDALNYNPEQTLYNLNWNNYVTEIASGKMLYTYARLTDKYINRLNFSERIFYKDAYYLLNATKDYNPINPGRTKIELLKVEQGLMTFPLQYAIRTIGVSPDDNDHGSE